MATNPLARNRGTHNSITGYLGHFVYHGVSAQQATCCVLCCESGGILDRVDFFLATWFFSLAKLSLAWFAYISVCSVPAGSWSGNEQHGCKVKEHYGCWLTYRPQSLISQANYNYQYQAGFLQACTQGRYAMNSHARRLLLLMKHARMAQPFDTS